MPNSINICLWPVIIAYNEEIILSRFSSNSEAFASELLEKKLENIYSVPHG